MTNLTPQEFTILLEVLNKSPKSVAELYSLNIIVPKIEQIVEKPAQPIPQEAK
jgi:hypothetical protein